MSADPSSSSSSTSSSSSSSITSPTTSTTTLPTATTSPPPSPLTRTLPPLPNPLPLHLTKTPVRTRITLTPSCPLPSHSPLISREELWEVYKAHVQSTTFLDITFSSTFAGGLTESGTLQCWCESPVTASLPVLA
eukprot:CAMPEP_0182473014 /NCGR_PEP_ID=MMETSP1319-20130603/23197_1 /TAXON_ID=172717 /ORGANISM="Bolidomonas pacifica, Strain RCC208" /LENGTH=134 /DNA_ID=CAMNT_0024673765 /DNA_START=190 /DNA_END=590 /DNA_ORIENTATION=-